jgi:hypothetical protein
MTPEEEAEMMAEDAVRDLLARLDTLGGSDAPS